MASSLAKDAGYTLTLYPVSTSVSFLNAENKPAFTGVKGER